MTAALRAGRTGDAGTPKPVASLATTAAGGALLRPLLGYLRVPLRMSDKDIECRRRELVAYAGAEGFAPERVFVDQGRMSTAEFAALINALRRGVAGYVLVPTLHHLVPFPGLHAAMKDLVERATGARVVVMSLDLERI